MAGFDFALGPRDAPSTHKFGLRPNLNQVSVGKISADTDNDPDLYVSVVDGRRPTETDYDFKSELAGADSITIRSNDTFWMRNGLNTSAGVTVVVGVRQPKRGEYTLVLSSPNKPIFYEDNDAGKQQKV